MRPISIFEPGNQAERLRDAPRAGVNHPLYCEDVAEEI